MGPRQKVGAWATAVALVIIGISPLLSPAVNPANAPEQEFSAERAMGHVKVIGREPHPMGSAENARVRDYIVAQLRELGLDPELQTISSPDYFAPPGHQVDVTNIIATVRGTANTKAVALMAHYDTVPSTPGANDNSTAVAALLETARAVLAGPRPNNDLILLFTDAEEPSPRPGSKALLRHRVASEIGFIVNLEAAGGTGASLLAEVSGSTSWVVGELAAASADPVGYSAITEMTSLFGDLGTDFDSFQNAGYPGVHFAYMHNSPIYHTAADHLDSVDLGSLQHHGTHALGIARHFGSLDLAVVPDKGKSTFFAVGPAFVRYPASVSLPLAIVAFVGFGWAVVRLGTPRRASAVARSAGRTLAAALATAIAGTVIWLALVAVRSKPGLIESWVYLGLLLGVGMFGYRWLGPRQSPAARAGGVALWAVIGLGLAIISPASAYLFAWPALGAAVSLGISLRSGNRYHFAQFAVVAVPTLLVATPIVDIIFQMSQPRSGNPDSSIPYVAVAALFLGVLAIALLRDAWPTPPSEVPE
ncbi:MAG: M20/M25/M40 family metallo-hydrolase [bacterium]|nr:M20/M25/M40 family metallo-hydrolase [bacterium]